MATELKFCTLGDLRVNGREACEHFVDAHYADLFRWLHWLTGDPDEAADLTQATFLSFWESMDAGKSSTEARTWLFSIGRNVWRNVCRQRHQVGRTSGDTTHDGDQTEGSRVVSPVDGAAAVEQATAIRQAVVDLPFDLREAITLRYWQDRPYNEMAAILGITPELARQRVFQGRKRLRGRLREWSPGIP